MLKQTFLFHKWINGSYKISCPIYPPFSPISNMVYRQFYSIKFLCDEHRGQSAVILLQKYTAGNNYHLWFMNGGACKSKMIAPRLFSYTLWSTPGSHSKLSWSRIADMWTVDTMTNFILLDCLVNVTPQIPLTLLFQLLEVVEGDKARDEMMKSQWIVRSNFFGH